MRCKKPDVAEKDVHPVLFMPNLPKQYYRMNYIFKLMEGRRKNGNINKPDDG